VIARKPRQRYFGREFHEALWHGFQALSAGAKRLVLAVLVIGALYAVSGSQLVLWGTTLVAALVLFLAHDSKRRPLGDGLPTDEELRELDRLYEQDDRDENESREWDDVAAGNGHLTRWSYEEALDELLQLVGHQVTVTVGAASEPRSAAMLRGRLTRGADVTPEGEEEVLLFTLDRHGTGFFMAPDRFNYMLLEPNALVLYIGDAIVIVRDEGPARDRARLMHERRRRP
jgi:hypothetical protein